MNFSKIIFFKMIFFERFSKKVKVILCLDIVLKDFLLFLNIFLCYKKDHFLEDENCSFSKNIFLCFF